MQYISLLRGINVGGQKSIKMESLRNLCHQLDFANIATYIQSGNLIFESTIDNQKLISSKIQDAILKEYGFDVVALTYSSQDFETIINNNPFQSDKEASFLHISFFSDIPNEIDFAYFDSKRSTLEAISWGENLAYLYCPQGYGTSKLTNKIFESKLKIFATTRNWNTCCEILNIAKSMA